MYQVQRLQNYGKILIDKSWFYEIVLDNLDLHRTRLLRHSLIEEARLVLFIHCQDPLRKRPKDMLYCTREGSGACFSKVPKLFGRISGDIILFVSSKRRRLEARNFAVIFISVPFTTY